MALNTLTWQRCLANLAPSGTIEITENGEYDVTKYATADVSVSGGATLGGLADISKLKETPTIGGDAGSNDDGPIICGILDGDAIAACTADYISSIAIGATAFFLNPDGATLSDWSAYGYTTEYNELTGVLYTAVREIDLDGEIKTMTFEGDEYEWVVFQVPTLDLDHYEGLGIVYTGE